MKCIPLAPTDTQTLGYNFKLILTAADVVALTKATSYPLFPVISGSATFPAGQTVRRADLKVKTAAANGANTVTFSLGNTGSATKYHSAVSVKSTGITLANAAAEATASQLVFQFGTDASDLTAVTALDMEVLLHIVPTADISAVTGGL